MKTLITFLVFAGLMFTLCVADIYVIGPQPGGPRPYREGIGLIEILKDSESITCCAARIQRTNTTFQVDFASALADPEIDWPLKDGDIVFVPEHVFRCLNEGDSARILDLFRQFIKIRNGEIKKPADWQAQLDRLPTHTKKK